MWCFLKSTDLSYKIRNSFRAQIGGNLLNLGEQYYCAGENLSSIYTIYTIYH